MKFFWLFFRIFFSKTKIPNHSSTPINICDQQNSRPKERKISERKIFSKKIKTFTFHCPKNNFWQFQNHFFLKKIFSIIWLTVKVSFVALNAVFERVFLISDFYDWILWILCFEWIFLALWLDFVDFVFWMDISGFMIGFCVFCVFWMDISGFYDWILCFLNGYFWLLWLDFVFFACFWFFLCFLAFEWMFMVPGLYDWVLCWYERKAVVNCIFSFFPSLLCDFSETVGERWSPA